jgi:hypothetical protein
MTQRTAEIPLTEAEISALSRLLANAITDTGSNRHARIYRAILMKLDAAVPTQS